MGGQTKANLFARADFCPTSFGAATEPYKRTQQPIVTGTSVLGMKFDGGVLMVADMLGSYGSMARFKDIPRLKQCGDSTVVGAGGDLSDFQYIQDLLEELMEEDAVYEDGVKLTT